MRNSVLIIYIIYVPHGLGIGEAIAVVSRGKGGVKATATPYLNNPYGISIYLTKDGYSSILYTAPTGLLKQLHLVPVREVWPPISWMRSN